MHRRYLCCLTKLQFDFTSTGNLPTPFPGLRIGFHNYRKFTHYTMFFYEKVLQIYLVAKVVAWGVMRAKRGVSKNCVCGWEIDAAAYFFADKSRHTQI